MDSGTTKYKWLLEENYQLSNIFAIFRRIPRSKITPWKWMIPL
jgi:hypothetical protein